VGGCGSVSVTARCIPSATAATNHPLPPTTYHLPPIYYLLPPTSYLLPTTYYQLPTTDYLPTHTSMPTVPALYVPHSHSHTSQHHTITHHTITHHTTPSSSTTLKCALQLAACNLCTVSISPCVWLIALILLYNFRCSEMNIAPSSMPICSRCCGV
jgi:hypothetical protein